MAVLPSELVEAGRNVPALQALAGGFEMEGPVIDFVPRFPFQDGMSYSLLVRGAPEEWRDTPLEVWTIQRPASAASATTRVVAIYPSSGEVPVNQLRLYVHFSRPMSEGWAARAVKVRRVATGEPLEGVFLMEPELWDRDRRRLTLLLDPGRIKRGLLPNEEAGYPLMEGVPVAVHIDAAFRDAAGLPLRAAARRRYSVGPPVRARVDPRGWQYSWPAARSKEPLTVEFDRALDHALLEHSLWVNNAAGMPLAGRCSIRRGERSWRFHPSASWEEGRYVLVVDPRLEDLAGNSLTRVFDRDLLRPEDAPTEARPVGHRLLPGLAESRIEFVAQPVA